MEPTVKEGDHVKNVSAINPKHQMYIPLKLTGARGSLLGSHRREALGCMSAQGAAGQSKMIEPAPRDLVRHRREGLGESERLRRHGRSEANNRDGAEGERRGDDADDGAKEDGQ